MTTHKTQIPAPAPQGPDKQTLMNQRMGQLSQIYKNPIRQMVSQTEEIILNATNELMQNVITLEFRSKDLTAEIMRLRALCDANKINHTIPPVKKNGPNREARRAAEQKKIKKNNSK